MSDIPPMHTWECGCVVNYIVVDNVNTAKISPCKVDCEALRAAIVESQARGIDIEIGIFP